MATPRKATQRSTPAKRSPARKTTSRASSNGQGESGGTTRKRQPAPKSLRSIAVGAAAELSQLIGQVPEGIVAAEKVEDGWRVQVEVVESRRIPETTDILAVYEVDVDNDGTVTSYRRLNRYVRGRIKD